MTVSTARDTAIILAAIVAVGGALAGIAARVRQSPVIGEIATGILLGLTLLGVLAGHLTTWLFPVRDRIFQSSLASLGLVLLMLTMGFALDPQPQPACRRQRPALAQSSGAVEGNCCRVILWNQLLSTLAGQRPAVHIPVAPSMRSRSLAFRIIQWPRAADRRCGLDRDVERPAGAFL